MSDALADFWHRYEATLAQLLPPLRPGDGILEEKISAAEARLNLRLPRTLREFYLKVGGRGDINRRHNRLLAPNDLVEQDDTLVFYEENQAVVLWGLPRETLKTDDPPVVFADNSAELIWEQERDHLSSFLLDMLLWQAVNGGMSYHGVGYADGDRVTKAGVEWQRIELGERAGNKVLMRDGQILYVVSRDPHDAAPDVFGGGRTKEDFLSLMRAFAVDWSYSTLDDEEVEQEETDEDE